MYVDGQRSQAEERPELAIVLQPVRGLVRHLPGVTVHRDPYTGPFAAYHRMVAAGQTWDVDALLAAAGRCGGPVLDVGCGHGRIALALARAGHPVTAIDTSAPAIAHLRNTVAEDPALTDMIDVVHGDITTPGVVPPGSHALAVLGNLSVNMFATPAEATAVLAAMRRAVRPDGLVCFPVLHADALEQFAGMRGMSAVPFVDDHGRQRLLWFVLDHESAGPHTWRTLFTLDDNASDGSLVGHVAAVRERLWTQHSLSPSIAAAGLHVVDSHPLSVPAGRGTCPGTLLVTACRQTLPDGE
ncbi:class I SAM-dependent methyltransferase [Nonomuraea sp. NPDC050783]|uniref:class I SAM-dependent methyltransferase n=1 Tax=Nonomuraea sp. NPDC050783 TaxID=3154634 RepID=UPI0034672163